MTRKNPMADIVEGIVAISSLAVVAERIVDKIAKQSARPGPEDVPANPAEPIVAGAEPDEAESKKQKKPAKKAGIQIKEVGPKGFVLVVRSEGRTYPCAVPWGKFARALGPDGTAWLAAAAESETKEKKPSQKKDS